MATNSFWQGLKELKKKHRDTDYHAVVNVVKLLYNRQDVSQYKDHQLNGVDNVRELHISSDILLIY